MVRRLNTISVSHIPILFAPTTSQPSWSHVRIRAGLFPHATKAWTSYSTAKALKIPIFQRNRMLSIPHLSFSRFHHFPICTWEVSFTESWNELFKITGVNLVQLLISEQHPALLHKSLGLYSVFWMAGSPREPCANRKEENSPFRTARCPPEKLREGSAREAQPGSSGRTQRVLLFTVPLWQSQHIPKHQTWDCLYTGLSSPQNQENRMKKKKSAQETRRCGTRCLVQLPRRCLVQCWNWFLQRSLPT